MSSLLFFLAFSTLCTLFVLKDGPVMRRFINRHLGVPEPVGDVVTSDIAKSLRSYFLGVTIIAAFNGVVIGLAAPLTSAAVHIADELRAWGGAVPTARGAPAPSG